MLLSPVDDLRKTDTTEKALEALSKSRVKRVHLIGRRGPLHVAFTIKELREMLHLPKCRPSFETDLYLPIRDIVKSLQRPRKRLTELLVKSALDPPTEKQLKLWQDADKSWSLKLLRTPKEILSQDGISVSGIKLAINKLVGQQISEDQSVEETNETEVLKCGLVLKSVGYKSLPISEEMLEFFDQQRGIVTNVDGKVQEGLYCSGWLATGNFFLEKPFLIEIFNDFLFDIRSQRSDRRHHDVILQGWRDGD